ncbi:MAG: SpoIIE family protein phosphatase [Acidobacteria bacterium]|nr:SpoIIE family protein phosphatase [Acidobacteriota bacterium]
MASRHAERLARQFLATMPPGSQAALYAGIFCCFAPLGLLQGAMTLRVGPWWTVAATTLISGTLAIGYAWTIINRPKWFAVPLAAHLGVVLLVRPFFPELGGRTALDLVQVEALATRTTWLAVLTVFCLMGAYVSFFTLIRREGLRFSTVHAELRLAREIHASLVPPVEGERGRLAWRGASRPSGDVGGDLVDVVEHPGGWTACVADVSGHGVASGVLMGMFKTAFRAFLDRSADLGDLLTQVNRTLCPLRQPHMFVTVACVRLASPGQVEYVLAGHPPMLHVASRTGAGATWVGAPQMALALFDDARYAPERLPVSPGDVLVLVTDGLIEVLDRQDRELGLEGLRRAVESAARSGTLADIERAISDTCSGHGAQVDDQTWLIVRFGDDTGADADTPRVGQPARTVAPARALNS